MVYKKIKIGFHNYNNRFNRTILVREDINLIELGCVICTSLRAEFEHYFLFIRNDLYYTPDCFIESPLSYYINEVPMKKYQLKDLGDEFTFLYDTGDNWEFDCKVYKKTVKIDEDYKFAYLLNGKGQGIWEDNIQTLTMYLDGEIDPNCNEENEDKGIYFPWNFIIDKYLDFDTSFDLDIEKDIFDCDVGYNIEIYLEKCHYCGYELEVKPRNY